MISLRESQLIEERRTLQNPYAYCEEKAEIQALSSARRASEDPYSHIEQLPDQVTISPQPQADRLQAAKPSKLASITYMSDIEIEREAAQLQRLIWKNRHDLFANPEAMHPTEMLDPGAALHLLGYSYELGDGLGQLHDTGRHIEVAGFIDTVNKAVFVSRALPVHTRSFTGAHELGHAVLHGSMGMHRDKSLNGPSRSRPPQEWQADKFASYFLMPQKLVIREFESRFGRAPFSLTDDTSFALTGVTGGTRAGRPRSLRELTTLLASTPRFNQENIVPLNVQFKVSVEAMAIRLEELELVNW
jgi:hypothetical protein